MKITISHFRRIHIIAVTMCLLLTVSLFAADTNTGWNQYTQAASLYRQHAPAAEITKILEDVQKSTSDSVLYGRTVFLLSSAYEREHQYDKALTELQKINSLTGKFPNNMVSEAHFRRSLIYLKKLDFKAAEKQFQKSLEFGKHPFLHREALLGLAWLAADQNKWSVCDSLLSLQKVKNTLSSQDERGLILTARSAIARSQPEEAISLLENTTSQAGLYYLAQAHEMAGNRIMAVSVYKKLHDLFPNTPEAKHALFQAAEVFMRAGDWLAARSEFKRLLESGLSNADGIHFRLGWIYMNLNELENALAEFSYMPAAENVSYFKYMEAECLRRQGQADPANLNKSILLFHNLASVDIHSPLAPLAKLKAALTEMEKGDSTGSLVSLRQFISLYPKDELSPAVYFLLGMNENPANSQRYFDQIVQQNRKSQFFDVAYFALQNHDF
ncbi:MAG: tetratricopeptide repeat protein, partial [Calditrichaeota bacterium]|nr:tetratricopeptide repeat protein [Calditrichota bacterium]